jgi:hypothetical protein
MDVSRPVMRLLAQYKLKKILFWNDGAVALPKLEALEEGGWSAPRPSRFTPGNDPVPTIQEVGWAPGPAWTCAKNLASTGIRSPDRPACNQSLY